MTIRDLPPATAIRPDLPLVTTSIPVEQLTREHIGRRAVIPGATNEDGSRVIYDAPITDIQYERSDGRIVAVLVRCQWAAVRLPAGKLVELREAEDARGRRLRPRPTPIDVIVRPSGNPRESIEIRVSRHGYAAAMTVTESEATVLRDALIAYVAPLAADRLERLSYTLRKLAPANGADVAQLIELDYIREGDLA